MTENIRVGVIGAAGRMGREFLKALVSEDGISPSAAFDVSGQGDDWGALAGIGNIGVEIASDFDEFTSSRPAVVVDLSVGSAVPENAPRIIERGIPLVIGATGFPNETLDLIESLAEEHGVCCLVVPNFSIGANVMMELARRAAPFFPSAEIIERHHPDKKDAPSGTSLFTVSGMTTANPKLTEAKTEHEILKGARGGELDHIKIHSVRLPGIVAEQTVIFGGPGEVLEITHRSTSRECFIPGIVWAVKHVITAPPGLLIGLDQVLGIGD